MIFMAIGWFKEVKLKNRVGFVNNFSRLKIKSVVIFAVMFSNGVHPTLYNILISKIILIR